MHFDRGMKAVVETSERGGCDIRIKTKEELENDIVFFYQLRFADRERRHEAGFRGAYLERFGSFGQNSCMNSSGSVKK
jgi:hypothetical protein